MINIKWFNIFCRKESTVFIAVCLLDCVVTMQVHSQECNIGLMENKSSSCNSADSQGKKVHLWLSSKSACLGGHIAKK